MPELPVIDVTPLVATGSSAVDRAEAARQLDDACRRFGFFYVRCHRVDEALQQRLEQLSHELFALPDDAKERVAMRHGGRAWRGWFPVGGELTSGRPDRKEGFYLGAELDAADPRVQAGTPLHGPNLFPAELPELRPTVLAYLDALTVLGQAILRGLALGLGLDEDWFRVNLTSDPLVLFRVFRYPPDDLADDRDWGVAEHTDYGLLTVLRQDANGGLEVHGPDGWVAAPPIPGTFVCNLGDMLERMTGGRYRSTPHRVRNAAAVDRLSFPFFLDPGWDADVRPVPGLGDDVSAEVRTRWDGADLTTLEGTYGAYLMRKVGKVFPALGADVLPPARRP